MVFNIINDPQIAMANACSLKTLNSTTRAIAARYDAKAQRVLVTLVSGVELAISPAIVQGLSTATPDELTDIEITPMGTGLYFSTIDVDIFIPAILQGFTGIRQWMARELGRQGGSQKSALKAITSRANGKLGGRPRKSQNV